MSPAPTPNDALPGRILAARYRIEARLARGGMASVYRAHDERLQRAVAVKVLSPPYADDPAFVARFLAEARTAASISSPNLAHVYDSGSDDDVHFMVLELLDRHRSLRDELRRRGRLPPLEAVNVALDVLAGLEPLHRHGMVHCDVKSGNVMIGAEDTKLIDFGIARQLHQPATGDISIGSLHAMSPEQLRGDPLPPSSDLFAVGVVLYEALTGRVPFPGDSAEEVMRAHDRGPGGPPSALAPGIVEELDDVVLQALRLDPTQRFASAAAMSAALRSAIEAQRTAEERGGSDDTTAVFRVPLRDVPHPPQRPSVPPPGGGRRMTTLLAALAAVAVGVVVLAVVLLGSPLADGSGPTPSPATPPATATLAPGTVRVPDTIGMSEAEAEAAARAAGLSWRIEWRVVPGQTPGIHDQEPAPGTVVRAGARFVMYAYRSR